jgi:hypothetical protein
VSELNARRLERNARLLVRAYPPGYRERRGEEVLGTLLETASPGRTWPPAREAASVITGGLRARRAANLRLGVAASLRQVVILGIALYLVQDPAVLVRGFVEWSVSGFHGSLAAFTHTAAFLPSIVVATVLAGAWAGNRWLVAGPTLVIFTVTTVYFAVTHSTAAGAADGWLAVTGALVLGALVPCTSRTVRPPTSMLWLVCLSLLVEGLAESPDLVLRMPLDHPISFLALDRQWVFNPYASYLALVPAAVAACWLVTDVRPFMGVAFGVVVPNAIVAVAHIGPGPVRIFSGSAAFTVHQPVWPTLAAVAIPLAIACALAWLLHRRARAASSAVG